MMAEAEEIYATEPVGEAQALAEILGWSRTRPGIVRVNRLEPSIEVF